MEEEILNKLLDKESYPDLKKRLISALVLIPVVILAIYVGGALFAALITLAVVIMSFEWKNLMAANDKLNNEKKIQRWEIYGALYIALPALSLLWLRSLDLDSYGADGATIVFWIVSIIFVTDIFAYFVGVKVGGPKLASKISPSKTWSGFAGGVIAAMLAGFIISIIINTPNKLTFTFISLMLAMVEQVSDLLESKIKRVCKVKDSSGLIPGHGGLLDRVDGFILTCPFIAIILLITQGSGILK